MVVVVKSVENMLVDARCRRRLRRRWRRWRRWRVKLVRCNIRSWEY